MGWRGLIGKAAGKAAELASSGKEKLEEAFDRTMEQRDLLEEKSTEELTQIFQSSSGPRRWAAEGLLLARKREEQQ